MLSYGKLKAAMRYRVTRTESHHHLIEFWAQPAAGATGVELVLPKWRPGRYELANYAKMCIG